MQYFVLLIHVVLFFGMRINADCENLQLVCKRKSRRQHQITCQTMSKPLQEGPRKVYATIKVGNEVLRAPLNSRQWFSKEGFVNKRVTCSINPVAAKCQPNPKSSKAITYCTENCCTQSNGICRGPFYERRGCSERKTMEALSLAQSAAHAGGAKFDKSLFEDYTVNDKERKELERRDAETKEEDAKSTSNVAIYIVLGCIGFLLTLVAVDYARYKLQEKGVIAKLMSKKS